MFASKKYICGLDIGSSKIAGCVAVIQKNAITDIFFEAQDAPGVKKGSIVDSIELIEAISRVIKVLKMRSGVSIQAVHTNIFGQDISTKHSVAIIPLAERGNKVISQLDIERACDQAFVLGGSIDEEAIHRIPVNFTVDNKTDIRNPLGLSGHKLAVDLYLVSAKLSAIQTITNCINQAGYDAKELYLSGLATSEVVFDENLKRGISILIDVGYDITELLVFKDGQLRDIQMLSIGTSDLTRELAEIVKVPLDAAKEIIGSYGTVDEPHAVGEDQEILIRKDGEFLPIKHKQVADILNAKTRTICLFLKDTLEKTVSLSSIDHCVLTGRATLQEGFLEMVEANMGIPVAFARIREAQLAEFVNRIPELSGRKYLTYITALGLICRELYGYQPKTLTVKKTYTNPAAKLVHKLTELYQEYF